MFKIKQISFILISILFIIPRVNYSQTDSTAGINNLLELSLEDLMGFTVTSASKKEEGLFDAPSIVATISAQEINDFGARNIYEVLERATSFYGISSYFFPQNTIGLRGSLEGHTSPNLLFLLNGRPVRESVNGGQNMGFLTTFPVSAIKQIEFIRGPGSVLYGSSAFIGVINIITKKAEEDNEAPQVYAEANGGSLGTIKSEASVLGSTNGFKYNASLNYYKTDGWESSDSLFFARSPRYLDTKMSHEVLASNLGLQYKGFTFSGFYGQNQLGKGSHTGEAVTYGAQRLSADIGYEKAITDWYTLNANITYNNVNDQYIENAADGLEYKINSNDIVYELTNFIEVNDQIELTIGGSVSNLNGEQFFGENHVLGGEIIPFPVDPYNIFWVNGYFQGDYQPTDWLKIVLGGQFNKIPENSLDFVPRVAVVAKNKKGFGTKILFGQAFRAPYQVETDIKVIAVAGTSDLTPQRISTVEVQGFYSKENGNIALTYFNSHQSDLIGRIANTDPNIASRSIYDNIGIEDSWGLELEGKYSISEDLYLLGSYSYSKTTRNDTIENSTLLPNHMFKFGTSYNVKDIMRISVFNSFFSSRYKFSEVYGNGTTDDNIDLGSFNWLTAKASFNTNKILNFEKPVIKLTIEGVNILNQEVYNPEILFNAVDGIQNRSLNTYYVGLQMTF